MLKGPASGFNTVGFHAVFHRNEGDCELPAAKWGES
jgi:hypothetical protein